MKIVTYLNYSISFSTNSAHLTNATLSYIQFITKQNIILSEQFQNPADNIKERRFVICYLYCCIKGYLNISISTNYHNFPIKRKICHNIPIKVQLTTWNTYLSFYCVVFLWIISCLFVPFFFWPLYCLYFFDLRILLPALLSSNFSANLENR